PRINLLSFRCGWKQKRRKFREFPAPNFCSSRVNLLWARQSRMWQHGFIREAERTVDCAGGGSHLKPLQQRNVLRVVSKREVLLLYGDGSGSIRQDLDWITLFEIGLADFCVRRLAGELPVRRRIADEGIGIRLSQFMAQRSHVLETGAKES